MSNGGRLAFNGNEKPPQENIYRPYEFTKVLSLFYNWFVILTDFIIPEIYVTESRGS